jgi:hypothetical protein
MARHAIHLDASSDNQPPGTIMCTCGWFVMAEPQVCGTVVMAPRCLRSPAMVRVVSADALNSRS